jgi:8-oxo-dGTP pyrophosphatase MutT (NUDIX family)
MKIRHCARAVVVNEQCEVLLLLYEDDHPVDPARPQLRRYWVTPGGGVKEGETHESAVTRELEEETGIHNPQIARWIWTRTRELLNKGEVKIYVERYYLINVAKAECPMKNRTTDEAIQQQRWWSLADIRESDDLFLPSGFPALVEPVLDMRLPESPIRIQEEP